MLRWRAEEEMNRYSYSYSYSYIGGDSKPSPGWYSLEMSYKRITLIREAENKKEFDIPERNYVLWNLQLRWW